jgi:limonene-1,2-epoxide hydrolase
MKPVQTPINGSENILDPNSPIHALVQFCAAFNNSDLQAMSRNWLQSDDVSMDNL